MMSEASLDSRVYRVLYAGSMNINKVDYLKLSGDPSTDRALIERYGVLKYRHTPDHTTERVCKYCAEEVKKLSPWDRIKYQYPPDHYSCSYRGPISIEPMPIPYCGPLLNEPTPASIIRPIRATYKTGKSTYVEYLRVHVRDLGPWDYAARQAMLAHIKALVEEHASKTYRRSIAHIRYCPACIESALTLIPEPVELDQTSKRYETPVVATSCEYEVSYEAPYHKAGDPYINKLDSETLAELEDKGLRDLWHDMDRRRIYGPPLI